MAIKKEQSTSTSTSTNAHEYATRTRVIEHKATTGTEARM
jgi:hypothetical protein